MSEEINLYQAQQLIEQFGGMDANITVEFCECGHSGKGLYAYHTDYPEEGATFLAEEQSTQED